MASDVDPSAIGTPKSSEPPVIEQAHAQPMTFRTREEGDAGAPPPSSAPEEMTKAPSPTRKEEPSD